MTSYIHIASRRKPWKPKEISKLILIWSHNSRILLASILPASFVRSQNYEFSLSLESLWNPLRLWYSEFPLVLLLLSQNPKVEKLRHSAYIRSSSSTPTCRDHYFWTVGRMRVYLYFLKRYQNYLPLLYCSFLLILHQNQSAWFCKIIISLNQNLYSRFFHLCIVFQRS
jgi:hypothetical protein